MDWLTSVAFTRALGDGVVEVEGSSVVEDVPGIEELARRVSR